MLMMLLFGAGLVALVFGADWLVKGASSLAVRWGMSPLVVGLTIVAFGTSAPEMTVSTAAVLGGQTDLAIGNAVGSNIFNVLFILGLAAIITPLAVDTQVIRQEAPLMLGAGVLLLVLALDRSIDGLDGIILLGSLIAYTVFLIRQSRSASAAAAPAPDDEVTSTAAPAWRSLLLVVVGLLLLVAGSRAMVIAAVDFARALGVSEVVIGLTVLAVGTSLPEVAASITAAVKGQRDLAVGNVVGSNIFNMLGVVGLAGTVAAASGQTLAVPAAVLHFDLWVMLAALAACLPVFITGREIARWEGVVFLAYYVAYTSYLILKSQHHDGLDEFSHVMMSVVAPLTVVTLVASLLKRRIAR